MITPEASQPIETVRCCPACHSRKALAKGAKAAFEILSCKECASLYTSTFPAQSDEQDYDSYYTEANLQVPEFTHKRLDEIVAGFESYRGEGRLLEVGFGAGNFLKAAARAGWKAQGVEISHTACEHSRAEGFEVFCGELAHANYQENSFDVVIASELLEHIPEPAIILKEIARILRPGGLLWATTPNAKGLSSRVLGLEWSVMSPPEHLQLFSAAGISRLLKGVGFRSVNVNTEGLNPVELVKGFRPREATGEKPVACGNERVNSGYRLNEAMNKSTSRSAIKNLANGVLRVSRLGDSLKIWAEL